MRVYLLFLCLISFSTAAMAGGGSEIGNGGDTVYCAPSVFNDFSGYYTLDYLLEYRNPADSGEVVEIASWDESKQRLSELFRKLYPAVFPHFSEFVSLVENTRDLGAARVWVPRALGLKDIQDENITRNLPDNCLDRRNGANTPQITQTVIRKMWNPAIQYEFDPQILTMQKRNSPLQYSFFMVHEWLWDITDQVDSIRKINWLLHSKKIESMESEEFQRLFRSFGLFDRKLSVCQRSEALKKGLARVLPSVGCEAVITEQLGAISSLDLSNLSIRFPFRVGDFYGFDGLESLNLSSNPELLGLTYPEFFSSLYSLKVLDLSACGVNLFPEELSRGLKYLEEMNLEGNALVQINLAFAQMSHLKKLRLSVIAPQLLATLKQVRKLPPSLEVLELQFGELQRGRIAQVIGLIQSTWPKLRVEQR